MALTYENNYNMPKKNQKRKKSYKTDFENHIPSIIFKIYLIPILKTALIIWLAVSGKLIAMFLVYLLFGAYKLLIYYKNSEEFEINNWIIPIICCMLLWPALDIFSFIPLKNSGFD